ncbi:MAG TPA: cytochrome P450 [Candidatus Saccharimonadales bacterium]|nr:cytochrome P450 [Candidatus Saccharimonadales bacterium]
MTDIFSDEMRRNPYPLYAQLRSSSPVFHIPPPFDAWAVFDYDGVKRVLSDHEVFSSRVPAPPHWFLFLDPPQHTKLRALISRAFTPKMVANLEPIIRRLSSELLDKAMNRAEMDLASEYSVPLPMQVIAGMIGIPAVDWPRFTKWSEGILRLSYSRSGGADAAEARKEFSAVTQEMHAYLAEMTAQRRAEPKDDLLTRLIEAEVDGERLSHEEILGFFQLLVVGGQETTTNLINNAILCLGENPVQLARLRGNLDLVPAAIEEVLRYRAPLQWVMRTPRQDVEMQGQKIPAGKLVLAVIGSANRDSKHFQNPESFDISRDPNPHVGFGHGIHSCLGAALSRMEAKIALTDILQRLKNFSVISAEPWQPRRALHVHGPVRLPIRFEC